MRQNPDSFVSTLSDRARRIPAYALTAAAAALAATTAWSAGVMPGSPPVPPSSTNPVGAVLVCTPMRGEDLPSELQNHDGLPVIVTDEAWIKGDRLVMPNWAMDSKGVQAAIPYFARLRNPSAERPSLDSEGQDALRRELQRVWQIGFAVRGNNSAPKPKVPGCLVVTHPTDLVRSGFRNQFTPRESFGLNDPKPNRDAVLAPYFAEFAPKASPQPPTPATTVVVAPGDSKPRVPRGLGNRRGGSKSDGDESRPDFGGGRPDFGPSNPRGGKFSDGSESGSPTGTVNPGDPGNPSPNTGALGPSDLDDSVNGCRQMIDTKFAGCNPMVPVAQASADGKVAFSYSCEVTQTLPPFGGKPRKGPAPDPVTMRIVRTLYVASQKPEFNVDSEALTAFSNDPTPARLKAWIGNLNCSGKPDRLLSGDWSANLKPGKPTVSCKQLDDNLVKGLGFTGEPMQPTPPGFKEYSVPGSAKIPTYKRGGDQCAMDRLPPWGSNAYSCMKSLQYISDRIYRPEETPPHNDTKTPHLAATSPGFFTNSRLANGQTAEVALFVATQEAPAQSFACAVRKPIPQGANGQAPRYDYLDRNRFCISALGTDPKAKTSLRIPSTESADCARADSQTTCELNDVAMKFAGYTRPKDKNHCYVLIATGKPKWVELLGVNPKDCPTMGQPLRTGQPKVDVNRKLTCDSSTNAATAAPLTWNDPANASPYQIKGEIGSCDYAVVDGLKLRADHLATLFDREAVWKDPTTKSAMCAALAKDLDLVGPGNDRDFESRCKFTAGLSVEDPAQATLAGKIERLSTQYQSIMDKLRSQCGWNAPAATGGTTGAAPVTIGD